MQVGSLPHSAPLCAVTDFVAVPVLPVPALEQWGLVTFQDAYLTFRSRETPFQMKVESLRVITNKIIQQWIGNLVTVAWWDDVWLKEGLSRYIMYTAASRVDPQAEISMTVLASDTHLAMEFDGFNTSLPLSRPLNKSADISRHLNRLTRAKAQKAQYERVTLNVTIAMREWVYKPGYPVVFVNRSYETNTFSLYQRRFIFGSGPVDKQVPRVVMSVENNPSVKTS
ncbi:hypothetical protein HPB48_010622 [Haemaphysalis longicornis]|uniref:Peptidase M1 membrane alanine aminopeptidase domain-containing protein n=1 Tax=Haemaphysalis longicornis TaxID=44386 RepID=A0A9J6FYQ2_HAELO|nr:hypothetical protein HPB48_010622 [Haemaphysalis longicornis]